MPNRLSLESSPYLLQHAQNPVDWYPWCDEAFERARKEDKPVFLSVGYSSCHWCHVMAHESFENVEISAYLNDHFISIKVDREERPDIDHIYMQAVQSIAGSGGWPLSVFLTPDRKPFSGGTYFPPEDRNRMPGFPRVLKAIYQAYHDRRQDLVAIGQSLENLIQRLPDPAVTPQPATDDILKEAYAAISNDFDGINGGFGAAPKFPHPMTLEFLLRYYNRYKDTAALDMVEFTLQKMASGGIYDQIGGGFHRYSTDDEWLAPHFEKMLYDNALLSRAYLQAYRVTHKPEYSDIVVECLDYVLREMRSPDGGFFSTQDADSEGREGKFYVWSADKIRGILGSDQSDAFLKYFGVSDEGNFEALNILHRTSAGPFQGDIKSAKSKLLAARERRIKPGRDEKVLTSWNGLMLTSMAEAAAVLKRNDYLEAAIACAEFLIRDMKSSARLKHVYNDGKTGSEGFLEDYAALIEGLLTLHQATLDGKWLIPAVDLCRGMLQLFKDESGLLYDTASGQRDLFARPRNTSDGAMPSGVAMGVSVLLKMAVLTGQSEYQAIAEKNINLEKEAFSRYPLGYSYWLNALDFYLSKPLEVVVAGQPQSLLTQELASVLNSEWRPNLILAAFVPGVSESLDNLPLFAGRKLMNGKPAVYICRDNTCLAPITRVDELTKALTV
jgi:uncharacterized protein YyaL (SSP411 family)